MYYEPYKGKNKKKEPSTVRRAGCFGRLLWFFVKFAFRLAILLVVVALVAYVLPPSLFHVEPATDLSITSGLPGTHTNILLLGVDKLDGGAQRSDTVIICSIGYNEVKLTSILRDTVVEIPGHGTDRINAAYAYGGAELAVKTVNRNFSMNISKYVVVDFYTLILLVDAVGGVDMVITSAEKDEINKNNRVLIGVEGLKDVLGYVPEKLEKISPDENTAIHLNGTQALAYARIRHIDSDFSRTYRQRKLVSAMVSSAKKNVVNPLMYVRLARLVTTQVETNMGIAEALSLATKAALCGKIAQLRLPVEGSYNDTGSKIKIDTAQNAQALYAFVYGD